MRRLIRLSAAGFLPVAPLAAQARDLVPAVRAYVSVDAPAVALTHARLVDGTAPPSRVYQTIVMRGERIVALGATGQVSVPSGARTIDLSGRTVIPGLI